MNKRFAGFRNTVVDKVAVSVCFSIKLFYTYSFFIKSSDIGFKSFSLDLLIMSKAVLTNWYLSSSFVKSYKGRSRDHDKLHNDTEIIEKIRNFIKNK